MEDDGPGYESRNRSSIPAAANRSGSYNRTAAWGIDVTRCADPPCNLDDPVLAVERVGQVERARTDGLPSQPQPGNDLAQQPLEVVNRSSNDALQRLDDLGIGLPGSWPGAVCGASAPGESQPHQR